ncbi:MAG: hypothetical protein IKD04_04700 [Clostridia bacterium]|nr:hypothetical protein [Clostridia bacterium]
MKFTLTVFLLFKLAARLCIKTGVESIKILAVKLIRCKSHRFTEAIKLNE